MPDGKSVTIAKSPWSETANKAHSLMAVFGFTQNSEVCELSVLVRIIYPGI